jgi:hypothetical protein
METLALIGLLKILNGKPLVLVSITIAETQMVKQVFGAILKEIGNTASLIMLRSVMLTTIGQ